MGHYSPGTFRVNLLETSTNVYPLALILCSTRVHHKVFRVWCFQKEHVLEYQAVSPQASKAKNPTVPWGRKQCQGICQNRGGSFRNGWSKRRTSNVSITLPVILNTSSHAPAQTHWVTPSRNGLSYLFRQTPQVMVKHTRFENHRSGERWVRIQEASSPFNTLIWNSSPWKFPLLQIPK